jgi:hypothetical protein
MNKLHTMLLVLVLAGTLGATWHISSKLDRQAKLLEDQMKLLQNRTGLRAEAPVVSEPLHTITECKRKISDLGPNPKTADLAKALSELDSWLTRPAI